MGCPLCATPGLEWTHRPSRHLFRCPRCRFAWIQEGVATAAPGVSIYESATPPFLSAVEADYYQDEGAVDAAREKVAWVSRHVPTGSTVLDVGANVGHFVREAAPGLAATGIEPSPSIIEWAHARHLPIEHGSIYDDDSARHARYDAVTFFDVLEHLPNPGRALEVCRRYLTPRGRLFITTPDTGSLSARILGRHWYYVNLHEHVALFDRRNLADLLSRCGFALVEATTCGRRYRLSYIERHLGVLAGDSHLLRALHLAARPLRLLPRARARINLGDVMGIVAAPTPAPTGRA